MGDDQEHWLITAVTLGGVGLIALFIAFSFVRACQMGWGPCRPEGTPFPSIPSFTITPPTVDPTLAGSDDPDPSDRDADGQASDPDHRAHAAASPGHVRRGRVRTGRHDHRRSGGGVRERGQGPFELEFNQPRPSGFMHPPPVGPDESTSVVFPDPGAFDYVCVFELIKNVGTVNVEPVA